MLSLVEMWEVLRFVWIDGLLTPQIDDAEVIVPKA
jgi:hypothetical protein